ncbi:response regulator, partial [Polaromonas sp.]|uniref:response regulator n=1 Tax=Polaromonas sp. TaxID=1869339 RepID=UPI00286B856D
MTTARPLPQATQGACTILFVDDEAQACKWFARLFADEFSIITAGSVDEALQALRARGPDIAVLVTDYRMPVRNGLALLQEVQ